MFGLVDMLLDRFGLVRKKTVEQVLKLAFLRQPHCGGKFEELNCGGNYFDRHNAINWISGELKLPQYKKWRNNNL